MWRVRKATGEWKESSPHYGERYAASVQSKKKAGCLIIAVQQRAMRDVFFLKREEVTYGTDGQVLVADLQAPRVFRLRFENNKLIYADRNWVHDTSNALPSVMDALTSLIDQGATKCTIEHAPITTPDARINRVFIDCGERGILLTFGSTNLAGQTYNENSVYERIGR